MLSIPAGYEWVLFGLALICVHCLYYGVNVGAARSKHFTKEFFADKFPELKAPPQGGYPDTGSGVFADKLPLDKWMAFNNTMRVHLNYIESLTILAPIIAISGLFNARLTFIFEMLYIVGRIFYGIGYVAKGAKGRLVGAILFDIALLFFIGNSIYGMFSLGGGIDGLVSFVAPKGF